MSQRAEVESGGRTSVYLEQGLFDIPYKGAGIAGAHVSAQSCALDVEKVGGVKCCYG